MKHKLLLLIFPLLFLLTLNVLADVQAIFNYKQFQIPDKGIYIENYLSFVSSSLKYKSSTSDKLQARLLITQILKKKDSIVDFKKYNVLGPELIDSIAIDFKDQQRFFVKNGLYELEIQIQDLNSNTKSIVLNKFISIKPYDLETNISDIELIDYFKKTEKKNNFSKSGYDIYPMVSNYISTEVEKLAFYYEVYNTKSEKKVLIKEYIETFYGEKLLPNYIKRSVKELASVTPMIRAFDLKKLPTGNYNLVVEIRDSNNQLITKDKVFIQRVNAGTQPLIVKKDKTPSLTYNVKNDSLDYFLRSLIPVANTLEYKFLAGNLDKYSDTLKERYFIAFWQGRYGVNGIAEWRKYREQIKLVEQRFGTKVKRGYETDMGRVFLKYGKPNDLVEKLNEQGTYPYAIWHYYQTQNRSNVLFVFYQSTAVAEDFELIHSDMPGEITNRDWKYLLNMRVGGKDNRVDEDARRMR
jgi:GWxTD domain-containing protein